MIYKLSHRKLPLQALVLKEIARQVLPARCYSHLLHYCLIIKAGQGSGCYNQWNRTITMRTDGDKNRDFYVWVHELTHLVWYMNKNIKKTRRNVHAKAFKHIENRLQTSLKALNIGEIEARCAAAWQERASLIAARQEQAKVLDAVKQKPDYRLERTRSLIRNWETKHKRAENRLKKLKRREAALIRRFHSVNQAILTEQSGKSSSTG
jgi:hypothetical protein